MSFITELPAALYAGDAFSDFVSNETDFTLGTARAMAWMCQLAYETAEPQKIEKIARQWHVEVAAMEVLSVETSNPLPISSQAIIGSRGNAVIIAFAGTDPLTLEDWLTDLNVLLDDAGVTVGFAEAARAIWPEISRFVDAVSRDKIIFVAGHSLGGSLAALTAAKIDESSQQRIRGVYTFGMPRIGGADFAVRYNATLGSRTYRLVYGSDLVATLPPSFLGYRHVGRFLTCARGDKFDAGRLASTPTAEEPGFVAGARSPVRGVSDDDGPSTRAVAPGSIAARRTDPAGLLIEALPPPLRDHVPDRYIEATS